MKEFYEVRTARKCREIISTPGYWKDRAIQMGETYGALSAEYLIGSPNENNKPKLERAERVYRKMYWYVGKVRSERYNISYDYES